MLCTIHNFLNFLSIFISLGTFSLFQKSQNLQNLSQTKKSLKRLFLEMDLACRKINEEQNSLKIHEITIVYNLKNTLLYNF
jgi:hypothetical protein